MMKLYKTTRTQAELLIEQLQVADSFFGRAKGLLGRSNLSPDTALWIKPCRDIHTFFMRFAIDCVFLNRHMEIVRIEKSVKPFQLRGPYWKASSAIEFSAGFAEAKKLEVGDQLYVVN